MRCNACGAENRDDAVFCSTCGARMEPSASPGASDPRPPENGSQQAAVPTPPAAPPPAPTPSPAAAPSPSPTPAAPTGTPQDPTQQTQASATGTPKWYQKTWVIVLFLVFLWPVGLIFVFLSPWKKNVKIVVAIVVAALAIFSMSFARSFLASIGTSSSVTKQESFYGVTYKVDPSWEKSDDSDTSRTYIIDESNVIFMNAMDYTGYDVPSSEDYLIENSQSALASNYDITEDVTTKQSTLGGYDACRFDWKMRNDTGTELTMTEYLIFFDDYVVTVTFGGPASTYSTMSATYTTFANSLTTSGDGSFATASSGSSETGGLIGSGTSATTEAAPSTGSATTGSTPSTGSSDDSETTAAKARAATFQASLPDYCGLATAEDLGTTLPDDARATVYFIGYSDASQDTIVCYGTYYVMGSADTAKADFDATIQAMLDNGSPEGTRVDGDGKAVWTCSWNGVYSHMYQKGSALLLVSGSTDSMDYIQKLVASLDC